MPYPPWHRNIRARTQGLGASLCRAQSLVALQDYSWIGVIWHLGQKGLRFVMTLTHDDLADFTCSTRETISRTLGQFQKENLILIRGTTILISSPLKSWPNWPHRREH